MLDPNKPLYDECRLWIDKFRLNGYGWEYIYNGMDDEKDRVEEFLENQKKTNLWPEELDVLAWHKIVDYKRQNEENRIRYQESVGRALIIDRKLDNEVTKVPLDPKSSWQLYKKHLVESGFKEESIIEIEDATFALLKRLSNNTEATGPIKGLVIGQVQSGKTANMAALMAMAADYGWNYFVVLSGTIENLRKQTQRRLLRDLNHSGNLNWAGLEHLTKTSPLGQRLQDLRFDNRSKMRYFTVCLKNSSRLSGLIEWLQMDRNKMRQLKIIVIDDEADQASINTLPIDKNERTKINSLIVNLVEGSTIKGENAGSNFGAMNYISYTATPYANFLNESLPESLYPKNFIFSLRPNNEYFGPQHIFGVEGSDVYQGMDILREIPIDDIEMVKDIGKGDTGGIPKSLTQAISWFICVTAAMRTQGYSKPTSMLVHTSQFQLHHKNIADSIYDWIKNTSAEDLLQLCEKIWKNEIKSFTKNGFRESYTNYAREDRIIPDYIDFDKIQDEIRILISEVTNIPLGEDGELKYKDHLHLCIDNCANNGVNDEGMFVRLSYPDPDMEPYPSPAPAFIVIGGSTLSRGLTIEGLVSTYFLRGSYQADTLMQMGRWFGYRRNYEIYQRLWMSADTIDKFRFLSTLEYELRDDLMRFSVAGASPEEFGPRVKNTPDISWLRVTGRNRMQAAREIDIDYSGVSPQTIIFEDNIEKMRENKTVFKEFVETLGEPEKSDFNTSMVWRGLDFKSIWANFLSEMNFHDSNRVFNRIEEFASWVISLTESEDLDDWNVILANVGNTEEVDEDKVFSTKNFEIGKVDRSRKIDAGNKSKKGINIGVLRAPNDVFADIRKDDISAESVGKLKSKPNTEQIFSVREEAGLSSTPQLLLYVINKKSEYKGNGENHGREPLDLEEDLIGVCIILPGKTKRNGLANTLTIALNKEYEEQWSEE